MAKGIAKILIAVWVIASALLTGAFAMSFEERIAVGDRVEISLDAEERRFSFVPEANSRYAIYLFSGEEFSLTASLYRGERLIGQGGADKLLIETRLSAAEEYTLVLSGTAEGVVEIMRDTLGRSFGQPIRLDEAGFSYSKWLVKSEDAHWYAFVAQADGPATIFGVPEEQSALRLEAIFTDGQGVSLQRAEPGTDGSVTLYAQLEAGKKYFVRLGAADGTNGAYRLYVAQNENFSGLPEKVELSAEEISLEVGQRQSVQSRVLPQGAHPAVTWISSDPQVAKVTQEGEITAVGAGEATVTATAYGGVSKSVRVTVASVPLSGIGFADSSVSVRVGEKTALSLEFYPREASNKNVRYVVSDSQTLSVSEDGMVTGLQEGIGYVMAISEDGGFTDLVEVVVEAAAPQYRALVVGQQMYRDNVNKVRVGSINTAQNIAQMLGEQSLLGEGGYQTTIALDTTREETLLEIRKAFADAEAGDVSLFYITCHGYYQNGMSVLQMYDGSVITAYELERELRRVHGTVVVIVDCCGSGGLIGEASGLDDFTDGIVSVFSGRVGTAPFVASKYKVLASAALDQDSYRISFDETLAESEMATVLARALCDGAGWSLSNARRGPLMADLNHDRKITLDEIFLYTSKRVMWYLQIAGELGGSASQYVQSVQVYPQGDPFVLFGRPASGGS